MGIGEKINNLINVNNQLRALLDVKFAYNIETKDNKDKFLTFALGKAYKTHKAIVILCQSGYGEDAFMLARTLFELVITSLYILQDSTDERLLRYLSYDWVTRKEMLDYAKTKDNILEDINRKIDLSGGEKNDLDVIEAEYKKVMEKYKYRLGWSDKNLKEMCDSINRLDAYQTIYRLQCMISHTSARSMNQYVFEDKSGQLTVEVGANENLVDTTLVVAFEFLALLIEKASEKYGWQSEKEIDSFAETFVKMLK